MTDDSRKELYQQVILEHNKSPRNFRRLDHPTHSAEGYNPLCGDHLHVDIRLSEQGFIDDISFRGEGCAISKASASMMTAALKGKTRAEAEKLFTEFHRLITRELDPDKDPNDLGKLTVFSGIWQYPARVKCASLCWHTVKGALNQEKSISTE